MKLKGISSLEQHIEKIFVGLIFAALLGILAWQFLGATATVTVTRGSNKVDVPLSGAWDAVAENARAVRNRLDSSEIPEFENVATATEQIVQFTNSYRGPISPAPTLALAFGETANIGAMDVLPGAGIAPLPALAIHAPDNLLAASQLTLVSPVEVEYDPEVAKILPPAMPFDKAGVSVEATFNGALLREAFTTDPDGPEGPIRPMPRHWWETIQILDAELTREELGPDGRWTNAVVVPPMPGRLSLRAPLAEPISGAAQLKELVRLASDNADYIRRPPYYASAIGENWMTPAERLELEERLAEATGESTSATRIHNAIADQQRRLRDREEQLAKLGGGRGPDVAPPPPPPGGPGGGGKGPGGGGGGGGGQPREPRTGQTESQRRTLEAQIDRLIRDIAFNVERLRAMGEDVSMYIASETPTAEAPVPEAREAPLLDNAAVRVWAHDMTVERGKVYRYRLAIVMSNPMFGQSSIMVPEQQDWASAPTVRSALSEWSAPVHVDDDTYFFIVGANQATGLSRTPGARAELYKFRWGRWRRGMVPLEPGDRLEAQVKYPDISQLFLAALLGRPELVAGQPGRERRPDEPPPPSPTPSTSPIDTRQPGREAVPPRDPARPDPRADPREDPARLAQLPTVSEDIKVDAIFLSVAANFVQPAGRSRAGLIAYFRDDDGAIVARMPDEDSASTLRARLERSVSQGELDVRPIDPVAPPKPRDPPTRGPEQDPGGKSPGGGGGGGGG